jgi:hypothetical protein
MWRDLEVMGLTCMEALCAAVTLDQIPGLRTAPTLPHVLLSEVG